MEHIPNGELFDVLASQEPSVAGKPLAEGTSRRILRDVISGMAECYRFGVMHRDLKWLPQSLPRIWRMFDRFWSDSTIVTNGVLKVAVLLRKLKVF